MHIYCTRGRALSLRPLDVVYPMIWPGSRPSCGWVRNSGRGWPGPFAASFVARNNSAQLAQIVAFVDSGDLTVAIAESHLLAELSSIHRRSDAGQTRGKIILIP
jgi:NADPH:quinone reductase-like Zn-dependent oxidoreductase